MKRYFSCFFFFSLFAISFLSAQVNEKDLKKMSYDELKELFFSEGLDIKEQNKVANVFIKKAKKENNQSKLARGYYYCSLINEGKNKIIYFDSVINNTKTPKTDKNFPVIIYYEKGDYLESLFDFDGAVNSYLQGEKVALERENIEYYYHCKFSIGVLKSEKMGEVDAALPIFKEFYSYFEKKKDDKEFSYDYEVSLFAMADAYKSLKKIDSSTYYNTIGYNHSKKFKNEYLKAIFTLNEGANQVFRENFHATIDSVKKALPIMVKNDDKNNTLAAYYYYGKAYQGLGDRDKAIQNFKKVDSLYLAKGTITPEFTSGYSYLIDHYRRIGDKNNQLLYIDKFVKIDSILHRNYRQITKKIQKDYDIPHLLNEKELIISSLKRDKNTNYWVIGILGLGVSLSLFIVQRQKRQKKQYKERFEALMQQLNDDKNEEKEIEIIEQKNEEDENDIVGDLGIAQETVKMIEKQLGIFEKQLQYLQPNLSLQTLAQQIETNIKYLSIVVNAKKGKSFSNYVNDLRVDYAIAQLKTKESMRKYTITAIAEEVGFNTAESFSKAFFKRTGLKPSYFIKELQELQSVDN